MGSSSLPPGFRFHPTDEELVGYYLKRKVDGLKFELEVIPVIDLYRFNPWELPEKSFLPKRDMEWFFFCPRDRKYPNGSRTNRATRAGYWKATGKDRKVVCQSSVVGYRKTLVFYCGRAPAGDRTDWVMHEYRLSDDVSQESSSSQGPFALCRITKRNEQEQKSRQVGKSSSNGEITSITNEPMIIPNERPFQGSYMGGESNFPSPRASPHETTPMVGYDTAPVGTNPSTSSLWASPEFTLDSSKEYSQGQEGLAGYFPQNEFPNSVTPWKPYDQFEITHSSSYSNFTENVELNDDFSQFGSMSPFPGHGDYTSFFGNGSTPHEGYDWSS